jgi:hypothetical protein
MDPGRPFTFLDDRLAVGDSLLGTTSLDQLEYLHLDPKAGRKLHENVLIDITGDVRDLATEVAKVRIKIAELPDSQETLTTKRRLLAEADAKTTQARLYADLVVGAALASAGKSTSVRDGLALQAAQIAGTASKGGADNEANAGDVARRWLATDVPGSGFPREPLHWPLVFPEVFENGGFDAIIGNPPFLGGKKISGALGSAYRDQLVDGIGRGVKGHADLIAYFTLRAHALLNSLGQAGLIATNSLAQGDTREVGLDQLLTDAVEIRRAVKSEPWPSRSAVLEYCAIWTTRAPVAEGVPRRLDGHRVAGITAALARVSWIV